MARLFLGLLAFRLINALMTRTYFQPDEHWQSLEIAHKLVFGYGYTTWEWKALLPPSVWNGPIRSVLHPLVFVPLYWLLRVTGTDQTRLLVLAPRMYQAVFAAVGDLWLFKLADRLGGTKTAHATMLVNLTNLYTLFTATRTFSNTLESTVTVIALFYFPFSPPSSWRPDAFLAQGESLRACIFEEGSDADMEDKIGRRGLYSRMLYRSLWWAALACLLRPTNAVIWLFLVARLLADTVGQLRIESGKADDVALVRSLQVMGEVAVILGAVAIVGASALTFSLVLDTGYNHMYGQATGVVFTPLSFFHRNVIANLSLFYGANPWHWYLTQGIPVLCTTWLPFALYGWAEARRTPLAQAALWTVGIYSLLGHKEFRFLQPILPLLCLFAGQKVAARVPAVSPRGHIANLVETFRRLPLWMRTVLVTVQLAAAAVLLSYHCSGQEQIAFRLGQAAREGQIDSLGCLMPCHSTPWMSSLHWSEGDLQHKAWFVECPPPTPGQDLARYMDQSDFFYKDPLRYLQRRFPPGKGEEEENEFDRRWMHEWPSHLVVFDELLGRDGVSELLRSRGYKEVYRMWNSWKHEDQRRDGDIVVLTTSEQPRWTS